MDRKTFLQTCGYACLGSAALTTFLQSCASTTYFAPATTDDNRIVLKKSAFLTTEKGKTVQRKYVLVRSEKLGFPICVYQLDSQNYSALLMECTHKGCELQPHGEFLVCPCHGSEFNARGTVLNPPAEQNLHAYTLTTDHENIYIQL